MAAKIKKGDKVVVLAGRDKDRAARSRASFRPTVAPSSPASIWSSVTRARPAQTEGGILSKEASIDLSNLAIADPKDRQADARRIQDSRRRPQGPRRQAFRRPDRWLRQNPTRAARRRRPTSPPAKGGKAEAAAEAEGGQGQGPAAAERSRRRRPAKAAPKDYVARLKKLYESEIVPKLVEEFGYKNALRGAEDREDRAQHGRRRSGQRHQEGDVRR